MNETESNMRWIERDDGSWEDINENSFRQNDISRDINGKIQTVFHRYTKINYNSYQLKCKIKIIKRGVANNEQPWGEAKILFTHANISEEFRLDFMHIGELKTCRLTYLGFQQHFPLDVTKPEGFNIEFSLRTIKTENSNNPESNGEKILISLKAYGNDVFKDLSIPIGFNGYIGFGTCLAQAEFSNIIITDIPNKKCFVVIPFNDRRDYVYEESIKKALDENGVYKFDPPYRLNESLRFGNIPKELQERLIEADLIIADISQENSNVFYEIGFSYALNKVILLLREDTSTFELPFDIRSDRHFKYVLPIKQLELDEEIKKLKNKIIEFIKTNVI